MVDKLFFSITFENSDSSNHVLSNAPGHIKNGSRSMEIAGSETACSQGGSPLISSRTGIMTFKSRLIYMSRDLKVMADFQLRA